MDWRAATISRRGNSYYAVMTVPPTARDALGGKTQLRKSCGTTDRKIAEQRRYELEGKMREQVLEAMAKHRLRHPESAYQRAVDQLALRERIYDVTYDPASDVVERCIGEAPGTPKQARLALDVMETILLELRALELQPANAKGFLKLYEMFGGRPPSYQAAADAFEAVKLELGNAFGGSDARPTLRSFFETYKKRLEARAENGDIKLRSAKEKVKFIDSFIDFAGDMYLHEVKVQHAYQYAAHLGATLSNSSVKTRVNAVWSAP